MTQSLKIEDIKEIRVVDISDSPEYTLWEIQYTPDNYEWYDLMDDPPKWAVAYLVHYIKTYKLLYEDNDNLEDLGFLNSTEQQ